MQKCYHGSEAVLPSVSLNQITSAFPKYPFQWKDLEDIISAYQKTSGDKSSPRNIPLSAGGNTDYMLGIKHLHYYPEKIFQLPSGLKIYKSLFRNSYEWLVVPIKYSTILEIIINSNQYQYQINISYIETGVQSPQKFDFWDLKM